MNVQRRILMVYPCLSSLIRRAARNSLKKPMLMKLFWENVKTHKTAKSLSTTAEVNKEDFICVSVSVFSIIHVAAVQVSSTSHLGYQVKDYTCRILSLCNGYKKIICQLFCNNVIFLKLILVENKQLFHVLQNKYLSRKFSYKNFIIIHWYVKLWKCLTRH